MIHNYTNLTAPAALNLTGINLTSTENLTGLAAGAGG